MGLLLIIRALPNPVVASREASYSRGANVSEKSSSPIPRHQDVVASIQALRAAAVVFVVLHHLFPAHIRGGYIGVDVFFVVSGFLISSHLLKELQSGDLDFSRFYLRRARRLLPASLLVLALTALGSYAFLPWAWEAAKLRDAAAAAIYGVNWWLAANAVNYFADAGVASPVNHYWSLSVEEQFYLAWPALMYFSLRAVMAKTGRTPKSLIPSVMGTLMGAILALSLISAILAVRHNQSAAYFVTYARAWEFAAGGLTALMLGTLRNRLQAGWAKPIFCAAWLTLVASSWFLTPESGVPGPAAIPAVLASMIVLVVGDDHASVFAQKVIGFGPIQWLGDISYSLYLWHWPLLIFAPFVLGTAKLSIFHRIVVLGISLVLSAFTKRQVEDRFRFLRQQKLKGRSFQKVPALAVYLLISVGLAGCVFLGARFVEGESRKVADHLYNLSLNPGPCFGARASEPGVHCPDSHRLDERDFALGNWQAVIKLPNGRGCQNLLGDPELAPCAFGSAEKATRKYIALLGDSHAGVWERSLSTFVVSRGIRVKVFIASACPISDDDHSLASLIAPEYRDSCRKWRRMAIAAIIADRQVDTVIVSYHAYIQKLLDDNGEWSEDNGRGIVTVLERFRAAGKHVIVIDDIPRLPFELPQCLAQARTNNDPCTVNEIQIPATTPLGRAVALMPPGRIGYLNFKDVFCDGVVCHSVIGGIPAYMDDNHISPAFAATLAPRLEKLIN